MKDFKYENAIEETKEASVLLYEKVREIGEIRKRFSRSHLFLYWQGNENVKALRGIEATIRLIMSDLQRGIKSMEEECKK